MWPIGLQFSHVIYKKEGSRHNKVALYSRVSSLPPLLKYPHKLTYYQNPAAVYEERCGAVCKTIA